MIYSDISVSKRHEVYSEKFKVSHLNYTIRLILVEKSFTDIDNRIIPNTLLIIPIPFFPRSLSILFEDLRIK